MGSINKGNDQRTDFEKVQDAMADYVSSDPKLAEEYLVEEGIDVDAVKKWGNELVRKLQIEARIRIAEEKKKNLLTRFQTFIQWFKDQGDGFKISLDEVGLSFRDLESLDDSEKERIANSALFLKFLDEIEGKEDETI